MTLFMDGASHYATAQLAQKWTAVDSTAVTWAVAAEGRTDGCIKRTGGASTTPGYLTMTPQFTQTATWTPTASGVFGCAYKIDSLSNFTGNGTYTIPGGGTGGLFTLASGGNWPLYVFPVNDGTFNLYRDRPLASGGPELIDVSIRALNDDEWAFLEFKWLLHASAGYVEIRSNGNIVLRFDGQTWPNNANFPGPVVWNSFLFNGPNCEAATVIRSCDHYLCDLEGAVNNDFFGDITVAYIKPNGVGNASVWTPSAGANWECVDEVPPNSDTDYVETTAAGDRDTYAFEDVVANPAAIQVCNYIRKVDEGGASVKVITRQSSTDYDGPEQGIGSTAYDYYLQPYDTNPDTSAQYTKAEMDAGQWGPLKFS